MTGTISQGTDIWDSSVICSTPNCGHRTLAHNAIVQRDPFHLVLTTPPRFLYLVTYTNCTLCSCSNFTQAQV